MSRGKIFEYLKKSPNWKKIEMKKLVIIAVSILLISGLILVNNITGLIIADDFENDSLSDRVTSISTKEICGVGSSKSLCDENTPDLINISDKGILITKNRKTKLLKIRSLTGKILEGIEMGDFEINGNLKVMGNIIANYLHISGTVDADSYLERPHLYDKEKYGNALNYLEDVSDITAPEGMYNYSANPEFLQVEVEIVDKKTKDVKVEVRNSLSEKVAWLRQVSYELKKENDMLKTELCARDNTYGWCSEIRGVENISVRNETVNLIELNQTVETNNPPETEEEAEEQLENENEEIDEELEEETEEETEIEETVNETEEVEPEEIEDEEETNETAHANIPSEEEAKEDEVVEEEAEEEIEEESAHAGVPSEEGKDTPDTNGRAEQRELKDKEIEEAKESEEELEEEIEEIEDKKLKVKKDKIEVEEEIEEIGLIGITGEIVRMVVNDDSRIDFSDLFISKFGGIMRDVEELFGYKGIRLFIYNN